MNNVYTSIGKEACNLVRVLLQSSDLPKVVALGAAYESSLRLVHAQNPLPGLTNPVVSGLGAAIYVKVGQNYSWLIDIIIVGFTCPPGSFPPIVGHAPV